MHLALVLAEFSATSCAQRLSRMPGFAPLVVDR
jgi:hypothetical protein